VRHAWLLHSAGKGTADGTKASQQIPHSIPADGAEADRRMSGWPGGLAFAQPHPAPGIGSVPQSGTTGESPVLQDGEGGLQHLCAGGTAGTATIVSCLRHSPSKQRSPRPEGRGSHLPRPPAAALYRDRSLSVTPLPFIIVGLANAPRPCDARPSWQAGRVLQRTVTRGAPCRLSHLMDLIPHRFIYPTFRTRPTC